MQALDLPAAEKFRELVGVSLAHTEAGEVDGSGWAFLPDDGGEEVAQDEIALQETVQPLAWRRELPHDIRDVLRPDQVFFGPALFRVVEPVPHRKEAGFVDGKAVRRLGGSFGAGFERKQRVRGVFHVKGLSKGFPQFC